MTSDGTCINPDEAAECLNRDVITIKAQGRPCFIGGALVKGWPSLPCEHGAAETPGSQKRHSLVCTAKESDQNSVVVAGKRSRVRRTGRQ